MKRKFQSLNQPQTAQPTEAEKVADLGKAPSNQGIGGSPGIAQPAASGMAMEFSFKGYSVRTVLHEGGTWFVATDICAVLELTDPTAALLRLDQDEKGPTIILTLGGSQKMNIISESGLYHLTFTSRKPQAKAFRRWVTGTVLPSIRKTGGYQSKDDAKPIGVDENGEQNAPTIVLPGPGRYVVTVIPDGAVHVHETEYSALLEEMTLADCRILCHTLHIIEGQWHKYQHRRSVASDRQDEFGLARLEAAILDGSRLAARCLKWHSGIEEERPGL